MPAGLDGNPDPIRSAERQAVIEFVADRVIAAREDHASGRRTTLVGIDGIDGSGKSTFADELATELDRRGVPTVRSSIDSFHNPRAIRWKKGRQSAAGFYLDSHDLVALHTRLLGPFQAGAGARYQVAAFDEPTDAAVDSPLETLQGDEVLLFDGIFIHRPELIDCWDLSIYLDGRSRIALRRLGLVVEEMPDDPQQALRHTLEWGERLDRYTSGMNRYHDEVNPVDRADIVIDNNDLARPAIVRETASDVAGE